MESEINDIREQKDYQGCSFSKFKKTDVRKELLNNLIDSKIEPACYWSAELICAGHFSELWDIILLFYSKHIHLGNPKLAIYLELRIKNFREIVSNGYVGNEIRLRNNSKIRRLFCEIMCILCDAKRRHTLNDIKISKKDFDMSQMTERFKAPNITYSKEVFLEGDPTELFVAINELSYHLSTDSQNVMDACYWIEWIINFESICKSKKDNKCVCERRSQIQVESKFQMDIIWIIWDLFSQVSQKKSVLVQKIVSASLSLFTLKYGSGCQKKRKYIMYFVVSILCENNTYEEEIIRESQKQTLSNVTSKINSVYAQIKKNEVSPGTEYLFKNTKAMELEKTIEKLETMNTFGETFIPRV